MRIFSLFHAPSARRTAALVLTLALLSMHFTQAAAGLPGVYAAGEGQEGVHAALTITSQPQDVTVKAGETAVFSVGAEGEGLAYQWYYRKSGMKEWLLWKGHTTASTSATANATWNLMQVYCNVTDEAGNTLNSDAATVRIDQPLTLLTQPANVTAQAGESVTFKVSAQGTGKLSYQWYFRKSGMKEWTLWKGHTTASTSATANATWNLMQVYCHITDEAGAEADSEPASVIIRQPLAITAQPESITVKVGDTAKFKVSAQGTGTLRYQWYFRKLGAEEWTLWKGHTTASTSAAANATWNLMQVYCHIADEAGAEADSEAATVTMDQPLSVVGNPAAVTVKGGETAQFSVSAQGSGAYAYQWYSRMPGDSAWSAMSGKTQALLSVTAQESMDGMQVYCKVTDATGANANSKSAKLTVVPAITITAQPSAITVHAGDTATFSVKASGTGLTYQWYYRKAGKSGWTLWKNKTASVVSGKADCTWHAMQVYCRITDSAGQTADSQIAVSMITKKSDQRYITVNLTVSASTAKIYDGPGTGNKYLGTVKKGEKFTALEWGSDTGDVTWYRFNWKGKNAWISRKNTTISNTYTTIPDRSFKNGGLPVIYLSPSRQIHNEYAYGSTTEGEQMYRVGNALKKILEEEYYCLVYMPPVEMKINLNCRPTDAYEKESDVYLAIHSNAVSSGKRYGAVGYYFPACAQSKKLGENMADEMGKISPFTPTVSSKTVNGMTAFDNIGYGEVRDPAYFGMISLLAEVEYHDNADSAKWIINNTNKIARALANALEKTIDMQKRT